MNSRHIEHSYSTPVGERRCDERLCLCVCLSRSISLKQHVQTVPNFLCMLPVAVARFSPGGVPIFGCLADDVLP